MSLRSCSVAGWILKINVALPEGLLSPQNLPAEASGAAWFSFPLQFMNIKNILLLPTLQSL